MLSFKEKRASVILPFEVLAACFELDLTSFLLDWPVSLLLLLLLLLEEEALRFLGRPLTWLPLLLAAPAELPLAGDWLLSARGCWLACDWKDWELGGEMPGVGGRLHVYMPLYADWLCRVWGSLGYGGAYESRG